MFILATARVGWQEGLVIRGSLSKSCKLFGPKHLYWFKKADISSCNIQEFMR